MQQLTHILTLNQNELKEYALSCLQGIGYSVTEKEGFLYAEPPADKATPVLLTAHLDTVYKGTPSKKDIKATTVKKYGGIIFSAKKGVGIGGDDRCGVYAILEIAKRKNNLPYIALLEDEEIGCVGADKFIKTILPPPMKFIVGLDRKGIKEAVYYSCDNQAFEDFITDTIGYSTEQGSFSDISVIAPALKTAAVNISCGYLNQHNAKEEFIIIDQLNSCIKDTMLLCDKAADKATPFYEYRELKRQYDPYYDPYYFSDDGYIQDMQGMIDDLYSTVSDLQSEIEELKQEISLLKGY